MRFACSAVLFDCDGVLVDSDDAVHDAWARWADDLGLARADVFAVVHGQRSVDTVRQFVPVERHDLELDRIDRYERESAGTVTAIAGAIDLTSAMPAGGWAVVTSGRTDLAVARLAAAGIPRPDVLVCADNVERGKPDPEGYLAAAQRLGVDPAHAIVLEDAPAGITAARAAGVSAVIGVGPRALGADASVPDLRSVHWTGDGLEVLQ